VRTKGSLLRVKRLESTGDSPPHKAQVKNEWIYTATPYKRFWPTEGKFYPLPSKKKVFIAYYILFYINTFI
jgi:hypothetical protein